MPPSKAAPWYLLAGAALIPLVVWWLGWSPGFASSDTIDQWSQVRTGRYLSHHPPIHTAIMGLLSLGGAQPGFVSLAQALALAVLLVYAAKWLMAAGVPTWLAVGAAWLLGLSPAVAPTTLALWKDVGFGLFVLWAWVELLSLAVTPGRATGLATPARLGAALAGIWLFRGNGPITVLLVLVILAWVSRRRLRPLWVTAGTLALLVATVVGPLYALLDVGGAPIEPAQVFLPDLAASIVDEPETFTTEDIQLLTALAPLEVWRARYDCYDSTPLLFDPEFDHDPIRSTPGPYRSLVVTVALRDPDTVIDHRVCASNFLYWPDQPDDAYFHRPPYEIPANQEGLMRERLSDLAFRVTDRLWRWAEGDDILWLTWRPAIVILPTLAAIALFALRRRWFLLPSALFLAHLLNVAATTPAQEFRYAYPLYLVGVLTLTLVVPAWRVEGGGSPQPERATTLSR